MGGCGKWGGIVKSGTPARELGLVRAGPESNNPGLGWGCWEFELGEG